ncbi:MAG: RsmE family RNA methyltransferase [Candidatus Aureabacteria bacterium]|nr:RsmE family RNA methyltransferase [Candidatus Auribacterota bacterium]
MHLHRIYISPAAPHEGTLSLDGEEAHYLLHVLRLGTGDEVAVFDGAGWSAGARVAGHARGTARLVIGTSRICRRPARTFAVAQAALKAAAMETVIQRCTELGASSILVFDAQRSIPRGGDASADPRLSRWRRTAIEACRQCQRIFLPDIDALPGIAALIPRLRDFDAVLLASLNLESRPLSELLDTGTLRHSARIIFIVGPEGDFSQEEEARFLAHGAVPCTLADAVLRADTAAMAGSAVIHQHLLRAPAPRSR